MSVNSFQPPAVPSVVERVVSIAMQALMNTRPKMTWQALLEERRGNNIDVARRFVRIWVPRRLGETEGSVGLEEIYEIDVRRNWALRLSLTYHPKKAQWWEGGDACNAIFSPHLLRGQYTKSISKAEAERAAASVFMEHYPVQTVSDKAIEAAKSLTSTRMTNIYPRGLG